MSERTFRKLAVIGAGNMGSGIAQKMATEGFDVYLVDLDHERVGRGMETIRTILAEGVERKIFRPQQVDAILGRLTGTCRWEDLGDADLVVEAVFEDAGVKREVFSRLDAVCRPDAVLSSNTSSLSIRELAEETAHPERVIGLHYFFHPAKNRLVEVVPGPATDPAALQAAWSLQEQLGKTPIASADAHGFVVNRFFVPWLNEAVRLVEEGAADIPSIEQACKKTFGVGMGPFELMNVTGVPIALHAATTLGEQFGPLYAPAETLRKQVDSGKPWDLSGSADENAHDRIAERMLGVVFLIAASLVDEGVGTIEDTDIGARVGLRWPRGPFQLMNRVGVEQAAKMARDSARRWDLQLPKVLGEQATSGRPFRFRWVRVEQRDGVAWLTLNRPDAMNALNEEVVGQLHEALREAAADKGVRGIVIGGAGKGFIAGADIRFFVRNIESKDLDRIVRFTREGHELLHDIEHCPKPVVARMDGLALGGGLELALACHRIVASTKAAMAFPETGIGIYPGLGGTQRTPRRVGRGLAKWLIYTGQMISAEKARDIGLVDRAVPAEQLDRAVEECMRETGRPERPATPQGYAAIERFFDSHDADSIRTGKANDAGDEILEKAARKVSAKAPVALSLAEKLIDLSDEADLESGLRSELDHLRQIFGTEDAYEGLSKLGRAKPSWKGR